jgi:hypothetical protein
VTGGGTAGGQRRRGVFAVDEDSALTELKRTWTGAGSHGFSVDNGIWSAIGSAGDVFTSATPDELNRKIRAHWRAML